MSEPIAEMELLRACISSVLAPGSVPVDPAPSLSKVNWDHVLWLAREQRSLLVLENALRRPRWAAQCHSRGHLAQVAAFREVNQMRALERGGELCNVLDLFGRHAVEAISLDRWALEQSTLGRPDLVEIRGPLGFVVRGAERRRAEALLVEAGHAVRRDPSKLVGKGRRPVVLNESVAWHPDDARVWSHAAAVELGGRRLLQPSPLHWLLQSASAGQPTGRPSLADAWGVASLVQRRSDWDWPGRAC